MPTKGYGTGTKTKFLGANLKLPCRFYAIVDGGENQNFLNGLSREYFHFLFLSLAEEAQLSNSPSFDVVDKNRYRKLVHLLTWAVEMFHPAGRRGHRSCCFSHPW